MSQDPVQSEVDDGDFIVTSTSTSQADLTEQLAPAEKPAKGAKETPAGDDDEATPAKPAKTPATATTPPADADEDDKDEPAKPAVAAKPGEKPAKETKPTASTPEGRVAQLKKEIATLTHEKHRSRQQREQDEAAVVAARQELADLHRQIAEKKGTPPADEKKEPAAAVRAPEPKEDDFEDFREWVKAHSTWTREQARLDAEEAIAARETKRADEHREADEKTEQEKRIAYRTDLGKKHGDRVAAFEAKTPGFKELMESAGALPTNPWMDEHILHSEHGPALMQYLAENPEECERISALGLGPTLIALGKIEAKFDSAPPASEPEPRPRTKAHPPVSAVGASASVAADDADEDLSTMPFGPEYVRKMNARDKARRQARL